MSNLSLFDLRPVSLAREPERETQTNPLHKGAGETGRPVHAGDAHTEDVRVPPTQSRPAAWGKSDGTDGVRGARGSEIPLSPDIVRTLTHKTGKLFPELVEGKPSGREFVIVELQDGRFMWRFEDGSFAPATKATTRFYVDDHVRTGEWREVRS